MCRNAKAKHCHCIISGCTPIQQTANASAVFRCAPAQAQPCTDSRLLPCIRQGPDPVVDGNILDAQITTQIAVLNQVYNPIGFSFVLQATDRTVNADWFQNMVSGSSQESAAQSALHTGNMGMVRNP